MLDKLSNAAAEKAISDKIWVIGDKASKAGLPVIIFLGTTIVSPGARLVLPRKTFLLGLSTIPLAFMTYTLFLSANLRFHPGYFDVLKVL